MPPVAPQRNLKTSLRQRRHADPMREFDRLPPPLRRWLADAQLPWSPRSVVRVWTQALAQTGGDAAAALARLDQAEGRLIARDAPRVWGGPQPGVPPTSPARP